MTPGAVVGLVAVGQIGEALAEVVGLRGWDDEAVDDNEVHVGGAGGAGIAQVIDLHGSGPIGEDLRPVPLDVAVQVQDDIHAVGAHALGDRVAGHAVHVDKAIHPGPDPLTHGAVVVRSE